MVEIINAEIIDTHLGYEGHGILTFWIYVKCGVWDTAFGGHALATLGVDAIKKVLDTVGVLSWEELPKKFVRIKSKNGRTFGLGHIIEDRWFELEATFISHERN